VLATACARATARAIRVQDALSQRESLDQTILGQLRSSVILVSKTKKTTVKIHHIALSANVLFRLTLPRTQFRYNRGAQMTQQRSRFLDKNGGVCAIAARHRPSARLTRRCLATTRAVVSRARIPSSECRDRPPERAFGQRRRLRVLLAWRVYRYTNSDCIHRQID